MTNNLIMEQPHQDTSLFNDKTKDNHFTPEDDKKSVNDDVMTEEDTDTEVEEDAVHKPFLNLPDTKYENKPEFHPYQNDDEITYHPTYFDDQDSSNSQLQQEISSPNALCPPSHVLKARRLSKNAIQSSTSTPISSTTKPSKITRKHSFVDSMNSNSAVSPRFMALRKLSEVTTLPSHSISYSSVPPVPQIPSIYQQLSDDHAKSHPPDQEFENRIINRIDDVLETQLQFHLGQVVWKSSEGYLDARQFWEDQKKEMFGFAASLIERLESHAQTHTVEDSIKQELNEYKVRCKLQSETLEKYKNKYQQHKTRYEETVNSLNDYKRRYEDMQRQVEELKAKQEEHKINMKQANEKINSHLETIAQLKESNNKLLNDSKFIKPSRSASIVSELLRKKSLSAGTDWADIMESEDEAKKSAEEWALKYRELQASYFDVCLKLEKNKSVSGDELNQSMSKKDQEIRHLKQAENVSRVQIEYLQSELLKYQQVRPNRQHNRKQKKAVAENNNREPGYVTEDGYLIFTTEINGKPSKYSIKIPNSCR